MPYCPSQRLQVSEGRMSPRAECPPGHLALGHNVPPDISPQCKLYPLSAECPPILVVQDRTHEGAVERKSQFEVSSINESSMEDDLGQFWACCTCYREFPVYCMGSCFSWSYKCLLYMWQSQVEIEHYSIVYFAPITVFEELQCRTSVKGGAHTCYVDA